MERIISGFEEYGQRALNAGATVLRTSYGEGFKSPSLFQLYSDFGNTRLDPEAAKSWDAGVEHRFFAGRLIAQATYFNRDTNSLIIFVSCFGVTDGGMESMISRKFFEL